MRSLLLCLLLLLPAQLHLEARAKVCGMHIEGSKQVRTSIPPALRRAMPERRWQSRVSATEGRLELAPGARWDVLGTVA